MKLLFALTLLSLSLLLLSATLHLTLQETRTTTELIRSEQAYYLQQETMNYRVSP
ncbi:MAG TPA: hypothetical protein VFV52_04565 [Bacilli bacterium]|nr:hypothetical protein [Bacilli bacterium]